MHHPTHNPQLRRRRNAPGHHAREHPRDRYEQPPQRPRSMLDSGLSRRNPVLRYPTREYQPDRASRTRQGRRPLSRAPYPADNQTQQRCGLTNAPPYQRSGQSGTLGRSVMASPPSPIRPPRQRFRFSWWPARSRSRARRHRHREAPRPSWTCGGLRLRLLDRPSGQQPAYKHPGAVWRRAEVVWAAAGSSFRVAGCPRTVMTNPLPDQRSSLVASSVKRIGRGCPSRRSR